MQEPRLAPLLTGGATRVFRSAHTTFAAALAADLAKMQVAKYQKPHDQAAAKFKSVKATEAGTAEAGEAEEYVPIEMRKVSSRLKDLLEAETVETIKRLLFDT